MLARLNFGFKIAKLTQFGWLSGTKWALGEPLERSKSFQERPKNLKRLHRRPKRGGQVQERPRSPKGPKMAPEASGGQNLRKSKFWSRAAPMRPKSNQEGPRGPREAQEPSRAVKSAPERPQERPLEPKGLQQPFWSDVKPSGDHFEPNFDRCQQHLRGNLLLHLRGAWAKPRRTAQRRSRKSCRKKLSKKSSKPPAGQMCRAHVPLAVVEDLRRSNGQ